MSTWSKCRWALLMLAALAVVGLSGCATAESENASERPWNAPSNSDYTGGLPSSMFQGR